MKHPEECPARFCVVAGRRGWTATGGDQSNPIRISNGGLCFGGGVRTDACLRWPGGRQPLAPLTRRAAGGRDRDTAPTSMAASARGRRRCSAPGRLDLRWPPASCCLPIVSFRVQCGRDALVSAAVWIAFLLFPVVVPRAPVTVSRMTRSSNPYTQATSSHSYREKQSFPLSL